MSNSRVIEKSKFVGFPRIHNHHHYSANKVMNSGGMISKV